MLSTELKFSRMQMMLCFKSVKKKWAERTSNRNASTCTLLPLKHAASCFLMPTDFAGRGPTTHPSPTSPISTFPFLCAPSLAVLYPLTASLHSQIPLLFPHPFILLLRRLLPKSLSFHFLRFLLLLAALLPFPQRRPFFFSRTPFSTFCPPHRLCWELVQPDGIRRRKK